MGVHWRFLWFVLISFSLLYQGIYFGVLSAVKSVIGVSLGVLMVWVICTVGRRLRPENRAHWLILHVTGYYYTSGAKGIVRQLFDLFVLYFSFGIITNYSLAHRSVEFSSRCFSLRLGSLGLRFHG